MQNTDPVYGGDTIKNFNLTEENRRLLHKVLQLDAKLANCQQRENELLAHIERLREALELAWSDEYIDGIAARKRANEVLAATPAQSLAQVRNQVREECAVVADAWEHDKRIAVAIRQLKEAK